MLNKALRVAVYLVGLYWIVVFAFAMYKIRELSGQAGMIVTAIFSVVIILLAIYELVRSKLSAN